ncbi:MAG: flagellar hook-basal body complex protein FliE [Gammaproteobacteria bacterium]|nr:flagellar hook-basal body complex protein FliE [Gammaproteobacteria bacterium]MDH5730101.1 flagellar hook-basal body complex protein FliE [Gammaproteobacteria bacterium]
MAVEPINLTSINSQMLLPSLEGNGMTANVSQPNSDFAIWLNQGTGHLNQNIQQAESQLMALATGETNNLHHVMLSLEKAKTELQLAIQVRNKLLEGYQEIMRMQV